MNVSEAVSRKKSSNSSPKVLGKDYTVYPAVSPEPTTSDQVKQVLAVIFWQSMLVVLMVLMPLGLFYCLVFVPSIRIPAAIYLAWVWLDSHGMIKGRVSQTVVNNFRFNPIWKHFQAYFNGKLVKTAEIDPNEKYIFGVHPHGLYAISMFANVWHNQEFRKQFPGIFTFGTTLDSNFKIPFWRDLCVACGTGASSKQAITWRLKHGAPGTACLIAVGGATEFKYMKKGTMDIVLKNRKGFIKIALTTGVNLVPVLSFGENDLYKRIDQPWTKPVNSFFRMVFRSEAPLFIGNNYGLPGREPLTTIVGAPIPVKQIDNPSQADIDNLHQKYMEAVQTLYDDYKDTFYPNRVKELQFI